MARGHIEKLSLGNLFGFPNGPDLTPEIPKTHKNTHPQTLSGSFLICQILGFNFSPRSATARDGGERLRRARGDDARVHL